MKESQEMVKNPDLQVPMLNKTEDGDTDRISLKDNSVSDQLRGIMTQSMYRKQNVKEHKEMLAARA